MKLNVRKKNQLNFKSNFQFFLLAPFYKAATKLRDKVFQKIKFFQLIILLLRV